MIRKTLFAAAALAGLAACAGQPKLFRTEADVEQRIVAAPVADVPARTTADAEIRSSPHASSPVLHSVPAGTDVLVTREAPRGWRRVKTADGKSGYVPDAAVQIQSAAATAPQ